MVFLSGVLFEENRCINRRKIKSLSLHCCGNGFTAADLSFITFGAVFKKIGRPPDPGIIKNQYHSGAAEFETPLFFLLGVCPEHRALDDGADTESPHFKITEIAENI